MRELFWAGLSYDDERNLEVEVSVLLATSIDVLLRFSYKMSPDPEKVKSRTPLRKEHLGPWTLHLNYLHMTTCCIFPLPGAISREK